MNFERGLLELADRECNEELRIMSVLNLVLLADLKEAKGVIELLYHAASAAILWFYGENSYTNPLMMDKYLFVLSPSIPSNLHKSHV